MCIITLKHMAIVKSFAKIRQFICFFFSMAAVGHLGFIVREFRLPACEEHLAVFVVMQNLVRVVA